MTAVSPPPLNGSMHVNLTVTDLERSTDWYGRALGLEVINDVAPPGSGFRFRTLAQLSSQAAVVLGQPLRPFADQFSEHRVGLHHLGYHVSRREDLDAWAARLDSFDIPHSDVITSAHEAGAQLWLRDPDNIWLEIYWPNRQFFIELLRKRWRATHPRSPATDATS